MGQGPTNVVMGTVHRRQFGMRVHEAKRLTSSPKSFSVGRDESDVPCGTCAHDEWFGKTEVEGIRLDL